MTISEIPLSPGNQRSSTSAAGRSLQMAATRRAIFWYLDIIDSSDADLVKGISPITGTDLLAQYRYLGLGFPLYMGCSNQSSENLAEADLGIYSHLYAVVE